MTKYLCAFFALLAVVVMAPSQPETPKRVCYVYSYHWVVFAGNNVLVGPEKHGIVRTHDIDEKHTIRMLASNLPRKNEDMPKGLFAINEVVLVPVFSKLTPLTTDQFTTIQKADKVIVVDILE